MNETTICHVKRSYKDTLFRMIFSEKDKLLSLYNTVSRNHYADPKLILHSQNIRDYAKSSFPVFHETSTLSRTLFYCIF